MRLSDDLRQFIASPVMIIIGTRDSANRPAVGRAVGARVVDAGTVEFLYSAWQWPETHRNLAANGEAALTFARPADYVAYQLKGNARLRAATPADQALTSRYQADIHAMFAGLGLPAELVAPWLADRELAAARLRVRELYVQTPGPSAGTRAGVPER